MEILRSQFRGRVPGLGPAASVLGSLVILSFILAGSLSTARVAAQESEDANSVTTGSGDAGNLWVVKVRDPALKLISPRTGFGAGSVYWYLIYTLHNQSENERELFVSVIARTNTKKTYSDLFLPGVERAAEKRERRPLWGKTDQLAKVGERDPKDPKAQYFTLKPGEKRYCIAVFNRIDPAATKVALQICGLSNDVRLTTREDGNKVLESRVKELSFERLGDEFEILEDSFRLKRNTWSKKEVVLAPTSSGS